MDELVNNHTEIATKLMSKIRPLEQFNDYLTFGCYPFYKNSLIEYPQKLTEVINITIDSDLSTIKTRLLHETINKSNQFLKKNRQSSNNSSYKANEFVDFLLKTG